jgi:rubrerythrin
MPVNLDLSTLDLMDALDLAILIEVEALERYKYFAEQIGDRFPGDAASIFRSMAQNEAKHGQQLNARTSARMRSSMSRRRSTVPRAGTCLP